MKSWREGREATQGYVPPFKERAIWTEDDRKLFQQAVNEPGGGDNESALAPKQVLSIMKSVTELQGMEVPPFTSKQVSRHMQNAKKNPRKATPNTVITAMKEIKGVEELGLT